MTYGQRIVSNGCHTLSQQEQSLCTAIFIQEALSLLSRYPTEEIVHARWANSHGSRSVASAVLVAQHSTLHTNVGILWLLVCYIDM